MGKVDLAFDEILSTKDITELSVVIYTDSFFYGLWDTNDRLTKVGYHPFESLEASLKLWDYHYSFKDVKLLSVVKPYVHMPNGDVDDLYFDFYFKGLYNLDLVRNHQRKIDALRQQAISTLHFLNRKVAARFDDHVVDYKVAHISTAMANYCQEESAKMVCFIANNKLHITLSNESGFRFYNQFDCYYDTDYLYYILLIIKEFGIDQRQDRINIGGDLSAKTELYNLLKTYLGKLHFVDDQLSFNATVGKEKNLFYDLYLCKKCVS